MKATKRYSRSTRKKAIDTQKDPYLQKLGPSDKAICRRCSAVYSSKRWKLPTEKDFEQKKAHSKVLCPACQKIRERFVGGYVTLRGAFVQGHAEELLNLIRNNEARAMYNNPLDRIIDISRRSFGFVVTTTTEKFAQRLGRILHKAFSGEVEYQWGGDEKVARVTWTRQR